MTVTYDCSLDSDDIKGLYVGGYGPQLPWPGSTLSLTDEDIIDVVKQHPPGLFVSEFGDDDVPKVVVSR